MELKKKLILKTNPIEKQSNTMSATNNTSVEPPQVPQLNNKIEKGFEVISQNIYNGNMNDYISSEYNKHKSKNVRFDPKKKGFTSIYGGELKANHFVANIAEKCNGVGIAYNTGFSKASMGFKAVEYKYIEKILKNKVDKGFYELLDENTPRKIFFDIDFYDGTIEKYTNYKNQIMVIFGREGIKITNKDITEYGYIGKKKGKDYLSYHLVINNGFVCKNQFHLYNLMRYMYIKYPKLTEMIDCCVYNKFRNFRLPYQSKNGDSNAIQKDTEKRENMRDYLILDRTNKNYYKEFDYETLEYCISAKTGKTIKITKTQLRNTLQHTNYFTCFPNGYSIDVGINDGSLEYIMKSIPNNEKVGYDIWLKVGMALKRTHKDKGLANAEGLEMWKLWTKGYSKDIDEAGMKSLYNGFKTNGVGINTLVKMAKLFNKKFDKQEQEQLGLPNLYEVAPNEFKNTVIVEGHRLGELVDMVSQINNHKVVMYRSPMGTGKTYGVRPILSNNCSILYVSCKRAFGNSIYEDIKEHGFTNYMNVDCKSEIAECDKILCSIESMRYCRESYDYVFFDECETLFCNMTAEMIMKNNAMENIMKLSKIIKNSNHLIFMDAYIGKRTVDFVKENFEEEKEIDMTNKFMKDCIKHTKKEKILYVENTYTYDKRTYKECVTTREPSIKNKAYFKNEIMTAIGNGKKIAVCSGSRTLLEEIELEILKKFPNKKYIFYNKKQPLKEGTIVDTEWDKIDILMYSPTITAGISYDLNGKNKQFDKLFIYIGFKSNPLARDMIQAHKRIRKFKDTEIIVCIMNIPNLIETDKLPIDMKTIKETEKNFIKDMYKEGCYTLAEIEEIKWLENVNYNNILERNVNDRMLPKTMQSFFRMENIVKTGNISFTDTYEEYDQIIETKDFNDIPSISANEYDRINNAMEEEDWDSLENEDYEKKRKYEYENIRIREDLNEKEVAQYYNINFGSISDSDRMSFGTRQKSHNIYNFMKRTENQKIEDLEWCEKAMKEYNEFSEEDSVVEFKNTKIKKTALIMDIFKRLDLYDKENNKIIIDKEFNTLQLEEMIKDYQKIRVSSINKMLNYGCLRPTKDKKYDINSVKAVIDNVFVDEFNMKISKPISEKKITVSKGIRKNVKNFRFLQMVPNFCVTKKKKEPYIEGINGFQVYRTEGGDLNDKDIDFLEEDNENENSMFMDKVSKVSKKDILQKYYPMILAEEDKEKKKKLSMEMNEKIAML